MDIYAIFLNEANAECWDKIREEWANGRHYILTDNLAFVASDGISTTVEVGKKIGITGDAESALGLVFEVGAYNGFNKGDLWEWLRKMQVQS